MALSEMRSIKKCMLSQFKNIGEITTPSHPKIENEKGCFVGVFQEGIWSLDINAEINMIFNTNFLAIFKFC